jgi:hypothetical protein
MYWQRRLPHWVPENSAVFVTWRLAGSKPPPAPAGGPRWLGRPRIAAIFAEALMHGDSVRHSYELFGWVITPNHVHVVMQPIRPLPEIMRWLKAATANRANVLLGRTGEAFWRREYFDRWIRTETDSGRQSGTWRTTRSGAVWRRVPTIGRGPVRTRRKTADMAYKAPATRSPALR